VTGIMVRVAMTLIMSVVVVMADLLIISALRLKQVRNTIKLILGADGDILHSIGKIAALILK
jgi:hypothetical protein